MNFEYEGLECIGIERWWASFTFQTSHPARIPLLQCPPDAKPLTPNIQVVPINCRGQIEQPLGVAKAPSAHRHEPHCGQDGLHVDVVEHVLVRDPQHELLDDVVGRRRIRCDLGLGAALVVGAAEFLGHAAAFSAKVPVDFFGLALVLLAVVVLHLLQSDHVLERIDVESECHGD